MNKRRLGWIAFWSLAIPLATMGAQCGGDTDTGNRTEFVSNKWTENRPGGFFDYKIELKDINSGKKRVISVDPKSREWKQCDIGESWPGCGMAGA